MYKLYGGGGLENVLTLIGEGREKKFWSKNFGKTYGKLSSEEPSTTEAKDSSESSGSPISNKKSFFLAEELEWDNLTEFLKRELALREKLTLIQRSKDCLGIKSLPKGKKYKNAMVTNTLPLQTDLQCHICGKSNHVPSIDKNGKYHVDYFSSKTFVELSPKNRRIELSMMRSIHVMISMSALIHTIRDSLRACMF